MTEDHANARHLAGLPHVQLDPGKVQSDIVIFDVDREGGAAQLAAGCLARKVKIHHIGPEAIRCVTHRDVDREDIDHALDAFPEITKPW